MTSRAPARPIPPLSLWTILGVGVGAAAIALLFFASFDEPFALKGDNKFVHFPMKLEAWRQWNAGLVPGWSNGLWFGFPLLGDATTGAFYLPHAIAFLTTPSPHLRAFDVTAAMHLGLLCAGTLVLLRRLGCGRAGCVLGTALMPLLPHVLGWTGYIPGFSALAWWPWVLVGADTLLRTEARARAIVLASIPLGAQVLAGYPEMGLYSGCMAAAWILTARSDASPSANPDADRDASLLQRATRTATLAATSALLAGPQLLPTIHTVLDSSRATAIETRGLLTLQGGLLDVVDPSLGERMFAVLGPFLGGATLLLALVAVVRRSPRSGVLLGIAAVALAASLGDRTPVYGLLSKIPLYELFRGPHKLFLVTQLCVAWLAALGLDSLLRLPSPRRWTAGVALVLGLASLTEHGLAFASFLPRMSRGHMKAELPTSDAMRIFTAAAPVLTQHGPGNPPPRVHTGSWVNAVGSLPMIFGVETTLGGGVALLSSRHQWLRTTHLSPLHLDALGVNYMMHRAGCHKPRAEAPIVDRGERSCIRENPDARPRYELLPRVRRAASVEEMTDEMAGETPPGTVAVLAPADVPLPSAETVTGQLESLRYQPGHVELEIETSDEQVLLVRESWAPGWEAFVDGQSTPVYPAAGLFFALRVPAGAHDVTLHFRPPGLMGGMALGLGWIGLAVWVFRRRDDAKGSTDPDLGSGTVR